MKYYAALLAMTLGIIFTGSTVRNVTAGSSLTKSQINYSQADLKNGALLYDNWLTIANKSPSGNHPLYPADSKKSGKSTWRCKECHGWDYIGDKGRYSKGSHYTGISGVYHAQTKTPEVLYNSLTNKVRKHDFSEHLPPARIWDLVKFLREGQVAIDTVVDKQGQTTGDASKGKVLYNVHCSSCHGMNGDGIDFKAKKEGIQGVGWLANDNPQESIHKILWGHPGSDMPSMITDAGITEQEAIDILTYSQLLGGK